MFTLNGSIGLRVVSNSLPSQYWLMEALRLSSPHKEDSRGFASSTFV